MSEELQVTDAKVAEKVVKDLVRGLNPVTGLPHFEQSTQNTPLLKAVMRSFRLGNYRGNLVNLLQELSLGCEEESLFIPLDPIQQQYLIDDFNKGYSLVELIQEYAQPAQYVIAYLIEQEQITHQQAAFFCAGLQRSVERDQTQSATVISLSARRSKQPLSSAQA